MIGIRGFMLGQRQAAWRVSQMLEEPAAARQTCQAYGHFPLRAWRKEWEVLGVGARPAHRRTFFGICVRFRWTSRPCLWQSKLDDKVSRPDCRASWQLPPRLPDIRSELAGSPRITALLGGTLKGRHKRTALHPPHTRRGWVGRCAARQYGRSLAGGPPRRCDRRGGSP